MSGTLSVREISVCWSIPNFAALPMDMISSTKFSFAGSGYNCEYRLECWPRGYGIDTSDCVCLRLCSSMNSGSSPYNRPFLSFQATSPVIGGPVLPSLSVLTPNKYDLAIIDKNNQMRYSLRGIDCLFVLAFNSAGAGYNKLINRSELLRNSNLLPDGSLNVMCTITTGGIATGEQVKHLTEQVEKLKEQLDVFTDFTCHFKALQHNEEHTDVVILAEDKEFPAHKCILSARSPVFEAMFSQEMKENIENKVIISDTKENVVKEMLTFIYTGVCPNIDEMAEDLFVAADKYRLDKLKDMCIMCLSKNLTVDNVCYRYLLSCHYNLSDVKSNIENFAAKNMKLIMKSPTFDEYLTSHQETMKRLVYSYFDNI